MSETNFSLPLVPLRGMVVFPKVEVRLDIGRDKSIRAVEEAWLMSVCSPYPLN